MRRSTASCYRVLDALGSAQIDGLPAGLCRLSCRGGLAAISRAYPERRLCWASARRILAGRWPTRRLAEEGRARGSPVRLSSATGSSSFSASLARRSSKRSTPAPALPDGATRTRPRIATTSASTRVRAPFRLSSTDASTRSARKDSSARSISRPDGGSGARTRDAASACRRDSSAQRGRRWWRTVG